MSSSPPPEPASRRHGAIVAAGVGIVLLLLLSVADFLPPGREWYSQHPMTSAAVSTVITFIAISLLLDRWLRERDRRREVAQLERVSTIAYRSLAQVVNDAGRNLLSPLSGADLEALGVPRTWEEDSAESQARLRRHGFSAVFAEKTGSWRSITPETHRESFRALLGDAHVVEMLFRCAAAQRRRLQDATALWAPVMMVSEATARDLGRVSDVNDRVELLQEVCRKRMLENSSDTAEAISDARIEAAYWAAIAEYEDVRDTFAEDAKLPSDSIVARRG